MTTCALALALLLGQDEGQVTLPVSSATVTRVDAVPTADKGSDVKDFAAAFRIRELAAREGKVTLNVGREPVYVVDGDTSLAKPAIAESSPFGFHPASVANSKDPYGPAREIGIRWHRGLYAYWILVQPKQEDIDNGVFHWEQNDREWGAVPESMTILANVGLPERVGKRGDRGHKPSSWKLNQPEEKYLAFVRAAVERYDGDGKDDMPGLKVPIRCWQVENEPDMAGNGDWEGFAHLQEITHKTIKEACPEATVLMGGQTGGGIRVFDAFYAPALKKLGGKCVDVYDLHHYGDAKTDWQGVRKVHDHIRRALDDSGYAKTDVWITEMGSYSGSPGDEDARPDPMRDPAPMGRGPRLPPQSEREQARDVVKRHVFPLALGVKKVFWAWGLMEGFKHSDGYFDHTGFIYDGEFDDDPPRGTRKLAYFAYRRMTEALDGADWSKAEMLDLGKDVTAVRVPRGKGTVTTIWRDPAYRLEELYGAEAAARLGKAIDALGPGPTDAKNARERFRALRGLILTAVKIGGPPLVEEWAPRDAVEAVERKVLDGAADAPAAVDELIKKAKAKFGKE